MAEGIARREKEGRGRKEHQLKILFFSGKGVKISLKKLETVRKMGRCLELKRRELEE
ncbi:unnamed protein product [Meloidogyne enterolobii]|uniref:Uncharacterized protein n=1 Tax=Meloidogyne enterolobii TaxID=390850 RepID=A0ACB0YAH3_MELEN